MCSRNTSTSAPASSSLRDSAASNFVSTLMTRQNAPQARGRRPQRGSRGSAAPAGVVKLNNLFPFLIFLVEMFRSCQKYLKMVKNIRKRRRGEIEQLISVFDIPGRNVQFLSEIFGNGQKHKETPAW